MNNATITFYPSRVTGSVPKGITILEAARRLGISVESPCGGTGKCGKDLVQVRINKTLDMVLACKTVVENDMEVTLPSQEKKDDMKIVDGFYTEGDMRHTINPSVRKEVVHNGNDLFSTHVFINDALVSVENGNTKSETYGIALDIGTTTLVVSLVNLYTGKVLNCSSTLNPLVYYGHDVMSRIKHSVSHKDGLLRMHREIVSAINVLIHRLAVESDVFTENIYQVMAAGNTTMQHIFLNKEIKELGEYPYKAETLDAVSLSAKELGVNIPEFAMVTTFPCISAYVGGDIVSGLVAIHHLTTNRKTNLSISSTFPGGKELPALFLDIGTNGEMVLLLNDRMIATSTAAGPCFEGVTISSGMRASAGAIEHVRLEEELFFDVIGGGKPRGICGSGLVEAVSELVRVGLVNSRGRLQSIGSDIAVKYGTYLFEKDERRYFRLAENVSISQEDIRQVQLAKAAIRAGVEILLTTCNIKPEELKTVIIAGAFGYHLKEESLFRTGFLPPLKDARILYVGNSSLEGAVRLLLNKNLLGKSVSLARTAHVLELSQTTEFENIFIREMHF